MFDALGKLLALVLAQFYNLTNSYGVAIILLTVVVRLLLFPLTAKQMRSMQGMTKLQPELKRLQAEHKDDRMKLQEEMTSLYKREGVNPVGGCLPLIMQIPVFIGLFNVIRGLSNSGGLNWLQIHVPTPKYLKPSDKMYQSIVSSGGRLSSFGFDLAQSAKAATGSLGNRAPFVLLVAGYVVTAVVQQVLAARRNPAALTGPNAQVQKIMKFLPIFMGIFYYSMPAGLVLYFVASNVWTIAQQEVLAKVMPSPAIDGSEAQAPAAATDSDSTPSKSTGNSPTVRTSKKSSGTTPVSPKQTALPGGKTPRAGNVPPKTDRKGVSNAPTGQKPKKPKGR